jgi:hypothetical protein
LESTFFSSDAANENFSKSFFSPVLARLGNLDKRTLYFFAAKSLCGNVLVLSGRVARWLYLQTKILSVLHFAEDVTWPFGLFYGYIFGIFCCHFGIFYCNLGYFKVI